MLKGEPYNRGHINRALADFDIVHLRLAHIVLKVDASDSVGVARTELRRVRAAVLHPVGVGFQIEVGRVRVFQQNLHARFAVEGRELVAVQVIEVSDAALGELLARTLEPFRKAMPIVGGASLRFVNPVGDGVLAAERVAVVGNRIRLRFGLLQRIAQSGDRQPRLFQQFQERGVWLAECAARFNRGIAHACNGAHCALKIASDIIPYRVELQGDFWHSLPVR